MTIVHIVKDGINIKSFELIGHAEYNDVGLDIVCAAISMATQTTLLGLEDVTRSKFTCESYREGYLKIELEDPSDEKASILTKTLELALVTLASQYPQNIQVYSR